MSVPVSRAFLLRGHQLCRVTTFYLLTYVHIIVVSILLCIMPGDVDVDDPFPLQLSHNFFLSFFLF